MLFNTLQFAIFFVIVYALYLVLNHKWQNRMLLIASCIFYGAWDWRFLLLMFVSISSDYFCGLKIQESSNENKRKFFLILSLFINLAILGFFKYFNFFVSNFENLLSYFRVIVTFPLMRIILPVGISFYTFQAMSYAYDVYKGNLKPTKSFLDYALFVTYFPQLVAGPIERATHLLPQVLSPRKFRLDFLYEGIYLICWGLFLKIFIADNLAKIIVEPIFATSAPYNGSEVLLALYSFAFQIFCDFEGYSSIARGLGRVMGFDIMVNFNLPYFATNPREFWNRWHISLSTWIRDYIYIPLGGNKIGRLITYRNLAIAMFLGGLWHGAKWTFVLWGSYHGALLIIHRLLLPLLTKIPNPRNVFVKKVWFAIRIMFFFHLICLGWLFFRAQSMVQIGEMLNAVIFNFKFISNFDLVKMVGTLIFFVTPLIIIQFFQFVKNDMFIIFKFKPALQICTYLLIIYLTILLGDSRGEEFIYFQF